MQADTNLQFIREKIYQVRSAIMYSMSNDLMKLPNSIVSAIKVDDEGQLWFVCTKPQADISQFNTTFPARLHFYRKGTMFHLEVSGKATIQPSENAEGAAGDKTDEDQYLLIKMTMNNVEYTEPNDKRKGKVESILEKGYQWIMRTVAVSHDNRSTLTKLNSMKRA